MKASRANSASSAARSAANLPGTNTAVRSELRRTRRPRVRDGVADVGQAADIHHQAFEAQAEAGVRHRAVAAEIAVPLVVRRIQAELLDTRIQHIQALLAL